jgi:hypothetical protein
LLDGGDFGWRDITGEVNVRGVGANDPSWAQMGSGPLYAYQFAVNDECWMVYHVPHDIVPDADIHFHAHWVPDGTNAQPVKWQWDFAYAKGFNQAAYPIGSETTVTAEDNGPGTAWQHMVTETAAQSVADLDEPDGLIYCRITRITNGGTENTDGIFLLTADVHYQSTNLATLNKSPSFYGS